MKNIKKLSGKIYFCLTIFLFSVVLLSGAFTTAHAGITTITYEQKNDSNVNWIGFNFEIGPIPGVTSTAAVFCDSGTSGCINPFSSTQDPHTWEITNGGTLLSFYFASDAIIPEATAIFDYSINDNGAPYSYFVAATPSVVPEPISAILFVAGGGTLLVRRFRKSS